MKKIIQTSLISSLALTSLLAQEGIVLEDANIRSNPTLSSNVVTTIKQFHKIDIIKKVYTKDNGTWYQTPKGYISIDLIEPSGDIVSSNPQYIDAKKQPIKEKILEDEQGLYSVFVIPAKKQTPVTLPAKLDNKKEVSSDDTPIVANEDTTNTNSQAIASNDTNKESKSQEDTSGSNTQSSSNNTKTKKESNYFIGALADISMVSSKKTDEVGVIYLNNQLDETGMGINFEGGRIFNDKYILALHYDYLTLNEVDFTNYYLSLDYKFQTPFNPYLGISLGISDLKWTTDPLVNSKEKDKKQSSTLYGIQGGTIHNLSSNWALISKFSYQFFNHETDLISTPAKGTIKYEDKLSIGVGVRYGF